MSEILESLDEGVLTLTFNRPEKRNALTATLVASFQEKIVQAAANPAVRCLVITGAGRAFCAGGDVGDMPSGDVQEDPSEVRIQTLRHGMRTVEILHEVPKPTLAIINGAAAGGGLAFALACDMRFCLDTAKITTAFSKIGAAGDSGVSYFLPRLVGLAKATELMFTADVITGQQAHDIGLVTQVAAADEFEAASRDYARRLAGLPTIAIGYMKRHLRASFKSALGEILDMEAASMIHSLDTEDHQSAVKAFMNKTTPVFEGR